MVFVIILKGEKQALLSKFAAFLLSQLIIFDNPIWYIAETVLCSDEEKMIVNPTDNWLMVILKKNCWKNYQQDIKPSHAVLETLNKDKENYGYGIKSIKAITKKYKGEFVWEWLEEEKLCKTRCVFCECGRCKPELKWNSYQNVLR